MVLNNNSYSDEPNNKLPIGAEEMEKFLDDFSKYQKEYKFLSEINKTKDKIYTLEAPIFIKDNFDSKRFDSLNLEIIIAEEEKVATKKKILIIKRKSDFVFLVRFKTPKGLFYYKEPFKPLKKISYVWSYKTASVKLSDNQSSVSSDCKVSAKFMDGPHTYGPKEMKWYQKKKKATVNLQYDSKVYEKIKSKEELIFKRLNNEESPVSLTIKIGEREVYYHVIPNLSVCIGKENTQIDAILNFPDISQKNDPFEEIDEKYSDAKIIDVYFNQDENPVLTKEMLAVDQSYLKVDYDKNIYQLIASNGGHFKFIKIKDKISEIKIKKIKRSENGSEEITSQRIIKNLIPPKDDIVEEEKPEKSSKNESGAAKDFIQYYESPSLEQTSRGIYRYSIFFKNTHSSKTITCKKIRLKIKDTVKSKGYNGTSYSVSRNSIQLEDFTLSKGETNKRARAGEFHAYGKVDYKIKKKCFYAKK